VKTKTRIALPFLVMAAVALLLFLPAVTNLITDWWWFEEVGYQVVFTRQLVTQLLLLVSAGLVAFLFVWINLRVAQRGPIIDPVLVRVGSGTRHVDVAAIFHRVSLVVALVIGALFGFGATPAWDTVLLAAYRTPFGTVDPVFGRDIGYYVFTMPALSALLGYCTTLVILSLILVLPLYLLRRDFIVRRRQVLVGPGAGVHVGLLVGAAFLLTALRLWLIDAPGLLYSTTGPLVGASYTDLKATLPALRLSMFVALACAVTVIVGGLRGRLVRYGVLAVVAYALVAIVGRGLVPPLMQKFVVAPTELTYEAPYLRSHIAATRAAWGLDSVEVRELGGEASLSLADVRASAATIENVRLWDREPLLQTFRQLQEIRTYYDFVSVDDDRYWVDGRYRQVLLSPRELNPASLPTRTFINEHLTFTHGMGLTLSPVNQVTTEGLPVLFIKDLPPVSTVSLKVTRPQIYYGENTSDFVVVRTRQREFDHPSGEANVYSSYTGRGGVPVRNALRRALLSTRFASSKILLSQDITDSSRVLFVRDIAARARKALPFLVFDRDPYMVVADDGTLKWLMDAYTMTDRYPYAARLRDGTSYMRNSVKVVIDAYDGTVHAFISTPGDPIVRTWAKILPGIFAPLDSMPADLRAHIRYPDNLYRIQTALYTTYHMDKPEDFYHREDQWQIPLVERGDGSVPFMRHIVMTLPGEANAEYIYMVPFTPRGKDNLAAWMVARNDGAEYGRLRVYQLPRQSLIFGPTQIENRINQNTEISRQVSLWDQRGSRVIRGDLLVIPIRESLLYVQPLYLQAEGGRIPELKRVVVAYQNQVVMDETLDGALASLFGGSAVPGTSAPSAAAAAAAPATSDAQLRSLVADVRRHYQSALDAQRAGDWARYGDEMREVGRLLDELGGGEAPRRQP